MVIGSLGIFGNWIYPKYEIKYYLFQGKVDGHWVIWCFQSLIYLIVLFDIFEK